MRPSEKLHPNRGRVREIVLANGAANPRVFGSILTGADDSESDIDLLIEPGPTTSLFTIAQIKLEIEDLLGVPVDVLTPASLPRQSRDRILQEAQPVEAVTVRAANPAISAARKGSKMGRHPERIPSYLERILEEIGQIEAFIDGMDEAAFVGSRLMSEAVARQITVVGRICERVMEADPGFEERYPYIEFAAMKRIGEHIIFDYDVVAYSMIWKVATIKIPRLKEDVLVIQDEAQAAPSI